MATNVMPLAQRLGLDAMAANYPPFFILVLEPLTLLSPSKAFWLWSGINLTLLLITVLTLASDLDRPRKRLFFFAAALLYGPVADALFWGQAEIVVLFLLVVALYGFRTRRDYLCGISLGLAVLWKVYPVLLLVYFLMRRQRSVLISACMTIVVGIVASAAAFGAREGADFVEQLLRTGSDTFWPYPMNISIGGVVSKILWFCSGLHPDTAATAVRSIAIVSIEALVGGTTVYATLAAWRRTAESALFGLWITTMVLLTPVIWFHHLVVLLIPLAQVVASSRNKCAFRLGCYAYCFSEVGLVTCWIRWSSRTAADLETQYVIGLASLAALILTFFASLSLASTDEQPSDLLSHSG